MIPSGGSHESSRHVIKPKQMQAALTCCRRCSRKWFSTENKFSAVSEFVCEYAEMITFSDDSPSLQHLGRLWNKVALITGSVSEKSLCQLCKSAGRFLGCWLRDNSAKKQSSTCDSPTNMRCNDNCVHESRRAKHRDCPIDVVFIPLGVILPLPTDKCSLSRLNEGSIDSEWNIEPRKEFPATATSGRRHRNTRKQNLINY